MEENSTLNLKINGITGPNFKPGTIQISEAIGDHLPRLVIKVIAGFNDYNLNLEEVSVTLKYKDIIETSFDATVDKIEFGDNDVTYYLTASKKEFYQASKVASFTSLNEAITSLYPYEIETDITDSTPLLINQVNQTEYYTLVKALYSLKSPSCFGFTLGKLKIRDLNNKTIDYKVEKDHSGNYVVEPQSNELIKSKIRVLPSFSIPVQGVEGVDRTNQISWGNKTIYTNSNNSTAINNIIENAKYLANTNHNVRVTFKYYPPFICGDLVDIHIKDLDQREFLVVERLVLLTEEKVEVSILFKPI